MRRFLTMAIAAAVGFAPLAAEARFGDRAAVHACQEAARAQYGARGFYDVTTANKGGGEFKVMGTMQLRGRPNAVMRCRYEGGRVTRLEIKGTDHGDGSGAALGAALGVAVGAAIIGAIAADHKHDHHESATHRPSYGAGRTYSPARNVTCYRRQRACYHTDGSFAPRWTRREFGTASTRPSPPPRVDEGQLRRYCAGEASARFHRNPRDITIDQLTRSRDAYTVYGSFDSRGRRAGFICQFDTTGGFRWIHRA